MIKLFRWECAFVFVLLVIFPLPQLCIIQWIKYNQQLVIILQQQRLSEMVSSVSIFFSFNFNDITIERTRYSFFYCPYKRVILICLCIDVNGDSVSQCVILPWCDFFLKYQGVARNFSATTVLLSYRDVVIEGQFENKTWQESANWWISIQADGKAVKSFHICHSNNEIRVTINQRYELKKRKEKEKKKKERVKWERKWNKRVAFMCVACSQFVLTICHRSSNVLKFVSCV